MWDADRHVIVNGSRTRALTNARTMIAVRPLWESRADGEDALSGRG